MKQIKNEIFKQLYRPSKNSHKGQNGKLTIIGGSRLFHGASLWALKTASRIVDMVFYSTVKENEELAQKLKSEIYDFIYVAREDVESYIEESDAVLIGPGLMREKHTAKITKELLFKFPKKKWIIDAGSLQRMKPEWLKKLEQVVITPHLKEFAGLFNLEVKQLESQGLEEQKDLVGQKAKEYGCVIVLKGKTDIVCNPRECLLNTTGNEGMTKGGTGDVLAGLIAALSCKNDLFLASCAGVYINGLVGDRLYQKMGLFFNTSDLCEEIPGVMKKLL